jgi:preprotein translocase subunit SecG
MCAKLSLQGLGMAVFICTTKRFFPMQNVLLVIQLLVAVALVAVILIQKTAADGGGLAGGGSTMGGLFTARGSANVLTRATAILASLFIVICLVLGAMASRQHESRSLVDQIAPAAPVEQSQPAPGSDEAPSGPDVPLAR